MSAAVVTECEACFTPELCRLRGTCDHYSAERLRVAAQPAVSAADMPKLPDAEWLAGSGTQAWSAETVRSWPVLNASRYTVPLFTADQMHAHAAAVAAPLVEALQRLIAAYETSHSPMVRHDCWQQAYAALAAFKEQSNAK